MSRRQDKETINRKAPSGKKKESDPWVELCCSQGLGPNSGAGIKNPTRTLGPTLRTAIFFHNVINTTHRTISPGQRKEM
jgi:hypothetical protein